MVNGPIIAGILIAAVLSIMFCCTEGAIWRGEAENGAEYKYLSPATLHRGTTMNWVGCTLTWIGLGIVSPLMFIYKCIYNLFHL